MATIGPQCANSWLRFIYTHNPFYVISAALVLYGLHVSFAGSLEPTEGWLLMRLLAGYTLMLAGAGIAVVKLGRVWEDARGLILLVILLVVAIASSFDRVCLDDDAIGAMFLGGGFAFAIIVCELIIRVLRLKLPLAYRGPIYLQLAVLFAYPVWLGRLSINDREVEMAWYVRCRRCKRSPRCCSFPRPVGKAATWRTTARPGAGRCTRGRRWCCSAAPACYAQSR
jgi:NADH:ubiquinone oxidoreductase subunit K